MFTEKKLVEDYFIEKLTQKGWMPISAEDLEREDYSEPLLIPNLIRTLEKINKNLGLGKEEISKVLTELRLTGSGMEGAKRVLGFYKSGVPVKFEEDKIVKSVRLFDYEIIENNEFIISRQVNFNGKERIRTDIILYINGIPLVEIECKDPTNIAESWFTAYKQIKGYEGIVPELYKYAQIGIAAESVAKYFSIVPWQEEVKIYEWKEPDKDSIDSTIEFLSKGTLLEVLRFFLFFRIERGEATKVITRYMQYRAANKITERVLKNLSGEIDKNKGLIWHWQGSGKTLTMIFAANKLFRLLGNPTVLFIVDRIELRNQLNDEYCALDIMKPEVIGTIDELREFLKHDSHKGKRGVFITLIHKFKPSELRELEEKMKELPADSDIVVNRKDIIAFIDEGHRTQYGALASQMKNILKKAFFFAFTGTPISKTGRDTYNEFSYPPEEPYLDEYFISVSQKDGFTKKIVYQPRLEEQHLKKELLEEFMRNEFYEELPEEIKDDVEEGVKKRFNAIKLWFENPKRIEVVAKDIAEHFKACVEGRFKAMVVAGSRKACVLYEGELLKYMPKSHLQIVMSDDRKEDELVRAYVESEEKRTGKDFESITKDAVEKYKEKELPKILIVTEMLLTGFDAPVLQTMYLDKPLKEHRLLQAIARTNRPFGDLKEAGVIIDYVGIIGEFKKAFEQYRAIKEDIVSAVFGFESVRGEFTGLISEILEMFREIPKTSERETLLKAVEVITLSQETEKEFVEKCRKLKRLFELLGSDSAKAENIEKYNWIADVYAYYRKVVVQEPDIKPYIDKYYDKALKGVYESIQVEKSSKELPPTVFDDNYFEKIKQSAKDKREEAASILFALNKMVLVDRYKSPIYESLVERVERLMELWKEKTKDYEKIYLEETRVLQTIAQLGDRKNKLGFNDMEYYVLLRLEEKFGEEKELLQNVKDLSETLRNSIYPGWIGQVTIRKEVEREIRRFARSFKGKYNLSMDGIEGLYNKLIEVVRNYGG